MSGYRAFFKDTSDGKIFLDSEESRHLCGSLRARTGENVDAFDMQGSVFSCKILNASQKAAVLEILSEKFFTKNKAEFFAAQALPKGKVFDEIIKSAAEIGASGLIPLLAERCEAKIHPEDGEKKAQKWNIRAIEAVKQSGNFNFSKIPQAQKLSSFLNSQELKNFNVRLIASLRKNAVPMLEALQKFSEQDKGNFFKACVLIGPEGDFSDAEYDAAEKCGFVPVSLGSCVMRCDTAASSALAVLSAHITAKKEKEIK